jgi:hypothetical protein
LEKTQITPVRTRYKEKCSNTTAHILFLSPLACTIGKGSLSYTKEEGNLILNRVKNQLILEQAERTRKRVEELNSSGRAQPKASTNAQLSSPTFSSAKEGKTLTEDLELPS